MSKTSTGGDGGPAYASTPAVSSSAVGMASGGGGGGGSSSSGIFSSGGSASAVPSKDTLAAMADTMFTSMGLANVTLPARADATWVKIYKLLGVQSKEDKYAVKVALVHLAMIYGTSDAIRWNDEGVELKSPSGHSARMFDVIKIIGQGKGAFRRFMATEEELADSLYKSKPEKYAAALSERSVRNGRATGEEFLAVDFIGRTGALDASVAASRVVSKYRAVARGEQRVENNFVRNAEVASEVSLRMPQRPDVGRGGGSNGGMQ